LVAALHKLFNSDTRGVLSLPSLNTPLQLLILYAARGGGVASSAEDMTVPLMQCLKAGSGRNLFMVLAMARPLFTKHTVGSLTSTD